MGITATARTAFRAALTTFKATGPNRNQLRRFVAALVDAGQEWLMKFDKKETDATAGFAASRQGQFNTYLGTLPDVTIEDRDDVVRNG